MPSVAEFWKKSYKSDRVAFWCELVGLVLAVIASMYLAINANAPDMRIVYPISFVGVVIQSYAGWRRGLMWVFILLTYFAFISAFGFGRAMGYY
jgi:hypothetical protein